ncbi:MAG: inositol monophosphatase [Gemmatimonadaceae bacterium]|nr:inositol monophosphatase [Gemmatimonadaceae bacterium]
MTEQGKSALLRVAVEAARAAGEVIHAAAPRVRQIEWQEKQSTDFVSEVDLAAEAAIRAVVTRRLPEAALLAEEGSNTIDPERQARGLVVVADPLDGTTNFLHGYPDYAVSIGILEEGALAAAVVLNVPRREEFTATAGGGSWLGSERIHVSTIDRPSRALIGTGFPFIRQEEIPLHLAQLRAMMSTTAGVRRPGAAAIDLASVACGRFDAFWELRLAPWDIAAGLLLVREAGGIVTDLAGAPCPVAHTGVLASNGHLHAWMTQQLHPSTDLV